MAAVRLSVYEEVEGIEYVDLHQSIDGKDYVQAVPEGAVEFYEQSGWSKASAKVANAAKKEDE